MNVVSFICTMCLEVILDMQESFSKSKYFFKYGPLQLIYKYKEIINGRNL